MEIKTTDALKERLHGIANRKPGVPESLIPAFFPSKTTKDESKLVLTADSLIKRAHAEALIGKTVISVNATSDDVCIMLSDKSTLVISLDGIKTVVKLNLPS